MTPPSDAQFINGKSYIQGSNSGSTGSSHSNDAQASFLVDYGSAENIDNLRQAGPSLLILNDTQISEADEKVVISASLTACPV